MTAYFNIIGLPGPPRRGPGGGRQGVRRQGGLPDAHGPRPAGPAGDGHFAAAKGFPQPKFGKRKPFWWVTAIAAGFR